ncbi:MAG TPA: ribbon-helix-helix protein, CopG family [Candidatus Binatia bacterium]|nr:ribbon-helix-helix protein, CopG family [Candidatus Binatia bacterium]
MSVRLDAKTTDLVDRLARRSGRTKSEVVRAALVEFARRETSGEQVASDYEALADFVGRFDSGGKQLSVRTGEQFAAHLRERKRARRLD